MVEPIIAGSLADARHVEAVHRDLRRRIAERVHTLVHAWADAVDAGDIDRAQHHNDNLQHLAELLAHYANDDD